MAVTQVIVVVTQQILLHLSTENSRPGEQTVAHNVPWVTTVVTSTYDESVLLIDPPPLVD